MDRYLYGLGIFMVGAYLVLWHIYGSGLFIVIVSVGLESIYGECICMVRFYVWLLCLG